MDKVTVVKITSDFANINSTEGLLARDWIQITNYSSQRARSTPTQRAPTTINPIHSKRKTDEVKIYIYDLPSAFNKDIALHFQQIRPSFDLSQDGYEKKLQD